MACHLPRQELREFLHGWREHLKSVLSDDPDNLLGRRHPALAKGVTNKFPSINIINLYLHPLTSFSDGGEPNINLNRCQNRQPDLAGIAVWSEKYFSWGTSGCILDRFHSKVWGGICIRNLMQVRYIITLDEEPLLTIIEAVRCGCCNCSLS